MIVNDLDFAWAVVLPDKMDAVLFVNSNA